MLKNPITEKTAGKPEEPSYGKKDNRRKRRNNKWN